jgi:hypothetical protein
MSVQSLSSSQVGIAQRQERIAWYHCLLLLRDRLNVAIDTSSAAILPRAGLRVALRFALRFDLRNPCGLQAISLSGRAPKIGNVAWAFRRALSVREDDKECPSASNDVKNLHG